MTETRFDSDGNALYTVRCSNGVILHVSAEENARLMSQQYSIFDSDFHERSQVLTLPQLCDYIGWGEDYFAAKKVRVGIRRFR